MVAEAATTAVEFESIRLGDYMWLTRRAAEKAPRSNREPCLGELTDAKRTIAALTADLELERRQRAEQAQRINELAEVVGQMDESWQQVSRKSEDIIDQPPNKPRGTLRGPREGGPGELEHWQQAKERGGLAICESGKDARARLVCGSTSRRSAI